MVQLAKHCSELFKCSEYEERRLLIKAILLNDTLDGVTLFYEYNEPFNLVAELNQSMGVGTLVDELSIKIYKVKPDSFLNNIK